MKRLTMILILAVNSEPETHSQIESILQPIEIGRTPVFSASYITIEEGKPAIKII